MKEVKSYELQLTDEQKTKIEKFFEIIGYENAEFKEISSSDEFLKTGDVYYFIQDDGAIMYNYYSKVSSLCTSRRSFGNMFRTKEDAEFARIRLQVLYEMKKFSDPIDISKWDNKVYYYNIAYNTEKSEVVVASCKYFIYTDLYFNSKEDAYKCIEAVGKDRIKKYYLGIID